MMVLGVWRFPVSEVLLYVRTLFLSKLGRLFFWHLGSCCVYCTIPGEKTESIFNGAIFEAEIDRFDRTVGVGGALHVPALLSRRKCL